MLCAKVLAPWITPLFDIHSECVPSDFGGLESEGGFWQWKTARVKSRRIYWWNALHQWRVDLLASVLGTDDISRRSVLLIGCQLEGKWVALDLLRRGGNWHEAGRYAARRPRLRRSRPGRPRARKIANAAARRAPETAAHRKCGRRHPRPPCFKLLSPGHAQGESIYLQAFHRRLADGPNRFGWAKSTSDGFCSPRSNNNIAAATYKKFIENLQGINQLV